MTLLAGQQQAPSTFFTPEQYQQIIQILSNGSDEGPSTRSTTAGTETDHVSIYSDREWIVDTGASNHMTFSLQILRAYKLVPKSDRNNVHLPTGGVTSIIHTGLDSVFKSQFISNVLYIPEFKSNLLLVSKLIKELKCLVLFFPDFCIFQDLFNRQVKGIGREKYGLYVLQEKQVKASCQDSKQQVNNTGSTNKTNYSYMYVVSDSSSLWHKSTSVKILRIDNGNEFFSTDFKEFLSSLGVEHQSTCVYTPQHNGIAERKHRTILEIARALRFQAGTPIFPVLDLLSSDDSSTEVSPTLTHHSTPMNDPTEGKVSSSPQIPEQAHAKILSSSSQIPAQSNAEVLSQSAANINSLIEPSTSMELKRSGRPSRPPLWMQDYVTKSVGNSCTYPISSYVTYSHLKPLYQHMLALHSTVTEPKTFKEAMFDPKWVHAIKQEVAALEDNNTWTIVDFPPGKTRMDANGFLKSNTKLQERLKDTNPY
ncbi:uncharacterized protein LOC142180876 [Nicotiana tabacum]|uniref:Uncharacterized protein LOC142180876 n=1 Tax=Nicotiana tabacum TaxID=4097 RepID=A0AC58UHY7_TOBAC